jgi:hypothetical protein
MRYGTDEERRLSRGAACGDRRIGPDHVSHVDHADAIRAVGTVEE